MADLQTDAVEKARSTAWGLSAQKTSAGSKTPSVGASSQTKAEKQESETEKDHIEIERVPQHEIGLAEAAEDEAETDFTMLTTAVQEKKFHHMSKGRKRAVPRFWALQQHLARATVETQASTQTRSLVPTSFG